MVHPAFRLRDANQTNPPQVLHLPVRERLGSWHPKISPYRLVVLTTTIGVGTAKAVLTQRGSTLAPIGLEWLAGTILFLLFFSISAYDSRDEFPWFLSWLFKPDCMNLVWRALESFSIPRPSYVSGEKPVTIDAHLDRPAITAYRVLVSCAVTSFGMSKAALGYFGLSTAVTWMDWALSVPITTILYVLGLYEYNSSHTWWYFFTTDQSEIFYSLNIGIKYTIGLLLSLVWTSAWAYSLWYITYDPTWDFNTIRPEGYKITLRTRIDDGYDLALKAACQEFVLGAIVAGIAALIAVFYYIARDVTDRGGLVNRALRSLRRPIVRLVKRIMPSRPEEPLRIRKPSSGYDLEVFISSMFVAFHILVHIGLHLIGIIGGLTFAMLSLGFSATMADLAQSHKQDAILRIGCVYFRVVCGFATLGCIINVARLLQLLMAPFLYWILESRPLSESLIMR